MKMFYGNTPIKSLNIKHFEMDTNSATVKSSDLQSGVICYGRGQKITGTGKCFEFASYGKCKTNLPVVVPTIINTIQIGSLDYPVKTIISMYDATFLDFSTSQKIAEVTIDGAVYPLTVSVQHGMLTVSCDHTIDIQLFYGKDNYV